MPAKVEHSVRRREAIREILRTRRVGAQSELADALRALGFQVTQSSVSRDLKEMGVARVGGQYVDAADLAGDETHPAGLAEVAPFILAVAAAGPNLLVVRTPPGLAASVAIAIDQAGWIEVIGTVAGDDTLFVATAGRSHQARAEARLASLRRGATHG